MKRIFIGLTAALSLFATHAAAQSITYYVQSGPYENVSNFTACPRGGCTTFTASQRLSGSFSILGPLGPNLVDEKIDVRLGDFDLSDGLNSYQTDFSDFGIVAQTAQISTDNAGNLTHFEFKFDKIHGEPATVGNTADPKSYVTSILLSKTPGNSFATVEINSLCAVRGDNVEGRTVGLGCAAQTPNASQGASQAFTPSITISLTPPATPTAVPTLSEWAMILFGTLLAAGAAAILGRRRLAA